MPNNGRRGAFQKGEKHYQFFGRNDAGCPVCSRALPEGFCRRFHAIGYRDWNIKNCRWHRFAKRWIKLGDAFALFPGRHSLGFAEKKVVGLLPHLADDGFGNGFHKRFQTTYVQGVLVLDLQGDGDFFHSCRFCHA